jgi:O-antigen ligase
MAAFVLAGSVAAAALAVGTVDLPVQLWLVGGVAGLALLALALWRYETAVAIGLLLLAVERFEPAPVDGVFAIVIAIALVTGRFDLRAAPLWITALIAGFVAMNLIAFVEATEPDVAAEYMAGTVYLLALAVWLAGFVDSRRRARLILVCYLAVAVASAVLATLALNLTFPGSEIMADSYRARARALFHDPNIYGPFLVVPTVLLLMELLEPRLLRLRTLTKLVLVGVLMVGVVFAYSRAAWLNLGVAIAVLLVVLPLRRGGGRRAVALLVAAVLGLAAVGAVVSITGSGDFLAERAQGQSYDTQRFGAQELGLKIASSNPVGIGPGQFEQVAPISAHSTYVRALAEEGVIGFVLLAALLVGTLLLAIRNVVVGSSTYGISSAALLAVWCGILANSLFVDTLHWRHLWVVAALIWAGAMLPGAARAAQLSSSAGARTPT